MSGPDVMIADQSTCAFSDLVDELEGPALLSTCICRPRADIDRHNGSIIWLGGATLFNIRSDVELLFEFDTMAPFILTKCRSWATYPRDTNGSFVNDCIATGGGNPIRIIFGIFYR